MAVGSPMVLRREESAVGSNLGEEASSELSSTKTKKHGASVRDSWHGLNGLGRDGNGRGRDEGVPE